MADENGSNIGEESETELMEDPSASTKTEVNTKKEKMMMMMSQT